MSMLGIENMSPEEVAEAMRSLGERDRQLNAATRVAGEIDKLLRRRLHDNGVSLGDPYTPPEGPVAAYPKDWVVQHAGHWWVAERHAVMSEPYDGNPDWSRNDPEGDDTLPGPEEDRVSRAQSAARIAVHLDSMLVEIHHLSGVEPGDEWQFPTSAAGAYPLGAVVTWEGRTWENITPSNPHQPGESGWAIVPEVDPETGEEIPPPYVQPAGAHDAYHPGKTITWEDGLVYRPTRGGVVHTPAESPGDWELEAAPKPEPRPVEPDPDEDEPVDPEPEESALPGWEVGKAYISGDQFTYQGATYSVLQGHTSAAHWPPDQVASLYEVP